MKLFFWRSAKIRKEYQKTIKIRKDMKQQDKELLLKDLCARLPYGVRLLIDKSWHDEYGRFYNEPHEEVLYSLNTFETIQCVNINNDFNINIVKPYLRPMSSMTKEERHDFFMASKYASMKDDNTLNHCSPDGYDWLNKKGFDYRGLIPMGLALEAPEGMYK